VSRTPRIPKNRFGDSPTVQLASIYHYAWRVAESGSRYGFHQQVAALCDVLSNHPSYLGPWTGIEHGHACRGCGKINGPNIEGYCIKDSQLDHRDFLDMVRELGGGT